ncbi:hypothetical protein CAEBREN_24992 [Caenorhabditis brenneri]|uniref:Uncharacterized protein n=1 Tax=Caenorhabditis brenneri TaxID=135651 RepID=G0NP69_CAEBE|nr:hypothetical protein CAEBREN_24992 [Caenorhabditis brenneri]
MHPGQMRQGQLHALQQQVGIPNEEDHTNLFVKLNPLDDSNHEKLLLQTKFPSVSDFPWHPRSPPPGIPQPPQDMLHAPPGIQAPGLQGMMVMRPPAPSFYPQIPAVKRGREGVKRQGQSRQDEVITLGDSPNGSPGNQFLKVMNTMS